MKENMEDTWKLWLMTIIRTILLWMPGYITQYSFRMILEVEYLSCTYCRLPCCLKNGTGYVNFLVPMIQLQPTSSYNCIRMGCLKGMMLQITFSDNWWWHFFLHAGYSFLDGDNSCLKGIVDLTLLFSPGTSYCTLLIHWGD